MRFIKSITISTLFQYIWHFNVHYKNMLSIILGTHFRKINWLKTLANFVYILIFFNFFYCCPNMTFINFGGKPQWIQSFIKIVLRRRYVDKH